MTFLRTLEFPVAKIYVPAARRKTLDQTKVSEIVNSWLESGQKSPILVREDKERDRFVLIEGYHRLEAARQLGEVTIKGHLVQARRH